VIEYVDHLHEHFVDPVVLRAGRYLAPRTPGFSAEILPATLERFVFPQGPVWTERNGHGGTLPRPAVLAHEVAPAPLTGSTTPA
ncbi:MAG TPA: hypothetical protein VE781_08960, partial [Kineosporiaceae bacterium]|nr:hypothetical protein [Kineosporiaceae bacterium]